MKGGLKKNVDKFKILLNFKTQSTIVDVNKVNGIRIVGNMLRSVMKDECEQVW